ncbi:MAG TPA: hypothetical protein VGK48_17250 [Terriglobia bacterium]|jgi:hypothetical protein
MKHFPLFQMGALAAAIVCLAPLTTKADDYDKKTIVTFDQPTEVPGIVLQPGKYVIKLLNSASNRHIAEVMNERMDHLYALTFTVAAERVGPLTDKQNDRILSFYEGKNGEPRAVRRWFWPGDTIGQEFLYPKNQADRIAANTGEKVPEGKLPTVAESGQSLAPDNANGLTLQSRDQDDATSKSKTSTAFTASAAEPAKPEPAAVIAQNTPPPQNAVPPAQPQDKDDSQNSSAVAASNSNPSDTTLPQTASYLPLIGLIGLISLGLALLISVRRHPSS